MENKPTVNPTNGSVKVNIFEQTYSLRSFKGEEHITQIAQLVDERMRKIAANTTSFELSRIAVLAALNIADELQALKSQYEELKAALSQASEYSNEKESAASAAGESDDRAPDRPQTWFEEIFDTEVPTKQRRERLSSQVSNKLQALRREDSKALNISIEEDQ